MKSFKINLKNEVTITAEIIEIVMISTSVDSALEFLFLINFKVSFEIKTYDKMKTEVLNSIRIKSFIIFAEETPAVLSRSHDSVSMTSQSLFLKILSSMKLSRFL